MITREQLLDIVPNTPHSLAQDYAGYLSVSMQKAAIVKVISAAAYIAQLAHETDSFHSMEEYASGDAYEGRLDLGNLRPGDGRKYKGRGWPMITGRAAYHVCGRTLDIPLEEQPELAAQPKYAALIGAWFWTTGASLRLNKAARAYLTPRYGDGPLNLNRVAENRDLIGVTFAINGSASVGHPCYQERRQEFFYRGLEVFGQAALVP